MPQRTPAPTKATQAAARAGGAASGAPAARAKQFTDWVNEAAKLPGERK